MFACMYVTLCTPASLSLMAQVLVFVHSRKETAKTAKFIKEMAIKEDKLARFMKEDRQACTDISYIQVIGMYWE